MFKHFASCLGTWGENCAYFLACYCLLLRLLGVGGGGGERIITCFVQRSWFQPCFKICCCMMFARGGGWEGGEDSNFLCSTHTESTTPVTRNRVQHGTEDVLPKVVVGHDMMEKRRIGQGISLRGHNRTCYKIATHDTFMCDMSSHDMLQDSKFPVQFFSFTSWHVPRRLLAVHPQSHVEPCFV